MFNPLSFGFHKPPHRRTNEQQPFMLSFAMLQQISFRNTIRKFCLSDILVTRKTSFQVCCSDCNQYTLRFRLKFANNCTLRFRLRIVNNAPSFLCYVLQTIVLSFLGYILLTIVLSVFRLRIANNCTICFQVTFC